MTNAQSRTRRDPGLWDRMVNDKFGGTQPILSGEESIAAAKKLYRHAMGRAFTGKVELTSGNRYTWVKYGVMSVNPDKRERHTRGMRSMIHDLSHYCHYRLHPGDKPHSIRQLRLEAKLVKFALGRRWHEGALAKPEKVVAEKAKPDLIKQRYQRMINRRDKYAKELERSKRLLAKASREVRAYETRHKNRLTAI